MSFPHTIYWVDRSKEPELVFFDRSEVEGNELAFYAQSNSGEQRFAYPRSEVLTVRAVENPNVG